MKNKNRKVASNPTGNSGRSKSSVSPQGIRRKKDGKELAPRSLRKGKVVFVEDCSEKDLEKVGLKG